MYSINKMTSLVCKDHLNKLINKYEKRQDKHIVQISKGVIKVVKQFIKDNNLILYGGTALNELLPSSNKIYPIHKLADYDVYSNDALNHAKELSNILADKGYKYIEMRQAALTDNTFKIFVENIPACDISNISKNEYTQLLNTAVKRNGILISSPEYLLKSLTFELSHPHMSYFRWDKLIDRYEIFNKIHGIHKYNLDFDTTIPNSKHELVLNNILSFCKKYGYPLLGNCALQLHQKQKNIRYEKYHSEMSYLQVITINSNILIDFCVKNFKCSLTKHDNYTTLSLDNINILDVFIAKDVCISTCERIGYKILTMFGIQYFLYQMLLNNKNNYIKYMIYKSNQILKEYKCSKECMIGIECYGDGKPIAWNIRKMRWNTGIIKYRPKLIENKNKSIVR